MQKCNFYGFFSLTVLLEIIKIFSNNIDYQKYQNIQIAQHKNFVLDFFDKKTKIMAHPLGSQWKLKYSAAPNSQYSHRSNKYSWYYHFGNMIIFFSASIQYCCDLYLFLCALLTIAFLRDIIEPEIRKGFKSNLSYKEGGIDMINIQKRLAHKKAKHQIIPGTYNSVVTNVAWADKYGEKEAIEISYNITCDGKIHQYREIFMNSNRNKRTVDFFDYLEANSIEDPIDFVGHTEMLTFDDVEAYNGNTYLNIVKREFIR